MDEKTFKDRTKRLGVNIIKMTEKLSNSRANDILVRQIIRSATSVGANYRAACRAKSTPDMINKLRIVEEEADETIYWLEICKKFRHFPNLGYFLKKPVNFSL